MPRLEHITWTRGSASPALALYVAIREHHERPLQLMTWQSLPSLKGPPKIRQDSQRKQINTDERLDT
jgi:hypothetical protein